MHLNFNMIYKLFVLTYAEDVQRQDSEDKIRSIIRAAYCTGNQLFNISFSSSCMILSFLSFRITAYLKVSLAATGRCALRSSFSIAPEHRLCTPASPRSPGNVFRWLARRF